MAWALLSHTAATGNASTVTTSAIDTTGATLIVVYQTGKLRAVQTGGCVLTDSQSNTNVYQPKPSISSSPFGTQMFFIVNPSTSASHTFTATGDSASFPAVGVMAFSGAFGGCEKSVVLYAPSSNTVQPGSVTPSTNDALIVSGYSNSGGTGTNTIDSGFTRADDVPGGAFGGPMATAYLIQTTAGAVNPTWTTTGGTVNSDGQNAVFLLQSAGGGGGGTTGGSYGFA